ncbi:MAG: S41 family peptidase [Leptolyngbyaceae cyanobacterium SM1_1_3]|nr:S41 family peptidase [Leptolyngbyaceae cyanobacterium SM1_1_3]NJN03186.1 S41 family peptidase [Leptolyngbyaceae cyanobacterium RM1_1_2]NJO08893.1 S41 family peptidase [Leptolyngbyaceae cyanobacterium SL_1_1]
MNPAISLRSLSKFCLVSGAIATTTLFSSVLPIFSSAANAAFHDSPKAVLDEAWQIVNQEYVDDTYNHIDWQTVRQTLLGQDYASSEQAYAALRQALRQLNDPYTRFLDPQQYAELTDQTSGEVSGVGLKLQRDEAARKIVVVEALPDSPAARAGIEAGDQILMVDGQSADLMSVEAVSQLIRGEEGSQVTLTVAGRAGQGRRQTIILTRALIEVETVQYALKAENDTRIGYIYLSEFNAHATEQMQEAIAQLEQEGVEAFVLDLRGNPGGLLLSSIEIGRMWLQRGSIVRTVDRFGNDDEISANRTALTALPLAVLVDNRSASSSEILTGALQDNGRATVVGTTTFGKALVQQLHALSDGSGIAVTVAHYYTPNGTDISRKGITPDIEVDLTANQVRQLRANPDLLATTSDPQYARAIAVLSETVLVNRRQNQPNQPTLLETANPSQLGRGI